MKSRNDVSSRQGCVVNDELQERKTDGYSPPPIPPLKLTSLLLSIQCFWLTVSWITFFGGGDIGDVIRKC